MQSPWQDHDHLPGRDVPGAAVWIGDVRGICLPQGGFSPFFRFMKINRPAAKGQLPVKVCRVRREFSGLDTGLYRRCR